MTRLRKIVLGLEDRAPRRLAEDWDNTGLQIGDIDSDINKVLLALDVTKEVVEEAVAKDCQLIIAHHPLIFKPLARLTVPNSMAEPVIAAIRKDIAVFCLHTNLDKAGGGTSHALAERLGLTAPRLLLPDRAAINYKVVTFAPEAAIADIFNAMVSGGAGVIGLYSGCSFRVEGTGTFYPDEAAHPKVGSVEKLNEVPEVRIEMSVPADALESTIFAMRKIHPYEEPAYDIYPLHGQIDAGLGLVADMIPPKQLLDLGIACKDAIGSNELRIAGDMMTKVTRVAVCGGSGGDLVGVAKKAGADVLVTGDLKYHQAREALSRGLALIDLGHLATEVVVLDVLEKWLAAIDNALEVIQSSVDLNPWSYIAAHQ